MIVLSFDVVEIFTCGDFSDAASVYAEPSCDIVLAIAAIYHPFDQCSIGCT